MKGPVSRSKNPVLQKAPQALMRAAEKARQLSRETGRGDMGAEPNIF